MKDYYVRLPIAGVISYSIEAETEEEAIDAAMNKAWICNFDGLGRDEAPEIDEIDVFSRIVGGNVFYGPLNEAEAEEE